MISAIHGIETLENSKGISSISHAPALPPRDTEPPPPIPPGPGSPASPNSVTKEPIKSRSTPSRLKGKERGTPEPPTETIKDVKGEDLFYRTFRGEESDLENIMKLVEEEFLYLSIFLVRLDMHRGTNRGYIGMLSVAKDYRRRGIGRKLVEISVEEMAKRGAKQVMLETEHDNQTSLALYDKLGFLREKRLHRFYSNEKDAFRLILPIDTEGEDDEALSQQLERTGPGLKYIGEEEDEMSPYFT
ncbi:peptide alpha-N-acetyltransferase [Cryptococcus gattii Ru294]|nr:peptide alpha-N-acetyltransferase [Cryptococcus gattii Ru294]